MANPLPQSEEEAIVACEPVNALREMIGEGAALDELFDAGSIAAAQRLIDTAKDEFFDTAKNDLHALTDLLRMPVNQENIPPVLFDQLKRPAHTIQGEARMLGFTFIASVCSHIVTYCEASQPAPRKRLALVAQLADALALAFERRIRGEGGPVEQQLLQSLIPAK